MNKQHIINRQANRVKRLTAKSKTAPLDKPKSDRLAVLMEQVRVAKKA
jgi:hypothetical protein